MGTTLPTRIQPGSIVNDDLTNDPNKIATVDKMHHAYKHGTDFGLDIDDTPVSAEKILFVATNAGVIRGCLAVLNVDGSSTDIDFDLKKNGVSILTAAINITEATGDGTVVTGTLASTSFAAGDIISAEMTVSSATDAEGPWFEVQYSEVAAP